MQHLRQLHGTGARLLGEAEDAIARWIPDIPKQVPWFSWRSNDTQLNDANIHHIIHMIHIIHIVIYIYYIYTYNPWFILKMPIQCSALFDPWHTLNCQDGPIIAPLTSIEVELEVWDVFFNPVVFMEGTIFFGFWGHPYAMKIAIIFPITPIWKWMAQIFAMRHL